MKLMIMSALVIASVMAVSARYLAPDDPNGTVVNHGVR
jgi:hypothetical protein